MDKIAYIPPQIWFMGLVGDVFLDNGSTETLNYSTSEDDATDEALSREGFLWEDMDQEE